MKKKLFPTDFSFKSHQTINYITKLFKKELMLFYFFNIYAYYIDGLNAIAMLHNNLNSLVNHLENYFNPPFEIECLEMSSDLKAYGIFTSK